jgi:peptide/nickel transport system substrate-binding protein
VFRGVDEMKRMLTASLILIAAVIICLCLFMPATGAAAEREVRIADKTGDWGNPSPYLSYARGPGYVRMHFIFDTLVWKNETAGPIPLLAEDWEYSPEEDVYVFNLAENAKWHDGEPVTADDVAFTITYMKEHPYGWVVLDSVDRAEVIGPHTVKIYMSSPYAPFMEDIGGTMPILPEHIWKDVANPMDFVGAGAFMGCGPFKYADFSKEHGTYRYEAFDEYYLGRPIIDRLIYVKTGDPQMALQHGEVDFADVKPDMADTIRAGGFVVIEGPHYWNKKLMINHNKEPLDNIVFRQALCYAINQSEFVDKSLRGHGKPASYGLISSESVWASPDVPNYPYNPDKAKEMISTLGYVWEDGVFTKDGKPLELQVLVSMIGVGGQPAPDRDGEILKNQLEKVGIRVDLTSLDTKVVDTKVINWDFDLAISGHGGIGGDPKILYEKTIQTPGAKPSPNTARYNESEELNELLDDLMHEMDPEKRLAAVHESQNVYARELPAISLYYPTSYYAYDPDVGVEWFYTTGGIAKGIPIPQNKLALIGGGDSTGAETTETTAIETGTAAQATPIAPGLAVLAILMAFVIVQMKRSNRKP